MKGISEARAQALALSKASERHALFGDTLAIDVAKTEERDLGWLFYVQSARFIEAGDPSDELLGVEPVFVHRATGHAAIVKRYGPSDFVVDGEPGHDWPSRATLVVPLAVVVQAATWVGIWLLALELMDWLGGMLLNLLVALAVVVVSVLPVEYVIRLARFRNFSPRLGGVVIAAGVIAAELALLGRGVSGLLVVDLFGVELELPLIVIRATLGIAAIGAGAQTLGQSNKSQRTRWEASRVIREAPGSNDE